MNLIDPKISNADHLSARSRIVTPQQRLSSAHRTLDAMNPVVVSMAHRHDPESLRRMAARALNLKLLLQHVFDDSIAAMAAHLEVSPDRLRSLIDLQTSFDPEIAEHLEHCLHLPGGWLDTRRTQIDAEQLKSIIFQPAQKDAAAEEEEDLSSEPQACSAPTPSSSTVLLPSIPADNEAATAACPPISSDAMSTVAVETSPARTEQAKKPYAATKQHRLEGPVAQTMQWLSEQLAQLGHKEASEVRLGLHEKLGRAQSTISTWTNNLRRLPDDVQVPMVRAIIEMRLPFAAEFLQRMSAASPHLFTEEVKNQLEAELKRLPPDELRWAKKAEKKEKNPLTDPENTPHKAAKREAAASARTKTAAHSACARITPSEADEDFRLVVARAAEKVVEVLQYIVRQQR